MQRPRAMANTTRRARVREKKPQAPAAGNDVGESSARRALWKGSVSFGLVQIPVSLVTAERTHELTFHQLDRRDDSPIGYERINKRSGQKVPWADIVKGYEVSKDRYVTVTDEDFKRANVEASQTIDIQDFVDASEIPPAYYERPYYLVPEGKNAKAYGVLRDAMVRKNLAAVALVVIRTRQHLCAVLARDGGLQLELLRFAHELRKAPPLAATPTATAREVELGEQLIASMTGRWDPAKYKDTYSDDLLAAIHEKAARGTIAPRNVPPDRAKAPVLDLVALLQQSVASRKAAPARRQAGSAHTFSREVSVTPPRASRETH